MDIRNIKSKDYTGDDHLEFMFKKGVEQLEQYKYIEHLPSYPLEVNTKRSQIILKDFIGRVIEELTEGYESLIAIRDKMNEYGWNAQRIIDNYPSEYLDILNNLQNANEEQADAMGFFITLLEYANILPDDIYNYALSKTGDHIYREHRLCDLMAFGVSELYREHDENLRAYDIFSKNLVEDTEFDYDKVNVCAPGFHKLSNLKMEEQVHHLWVITYTLNIARNLLKNRPWKQSPIMTKELDFQENLVKSFIYYLGYLAYNGFEPTSYTNLFYRKQQLNLWRIKTGY